MTKTFVLKELNNNAKADGNICKSYDNSAKTDLVAVTPEMESYYDHLMEWSV